MQILGDAPFVAEYGQSEKMWMETLSNLDKVPDFRGRLKWGKAKEKFANLLTVILHLMVKLLHVCFRELFLS